MYRLYKIRLLVAPQAQKTAQNQPSNNLANNDLHKMLANLHKLHPQLDRDHLKKILSEMKMQVQMPCQAGVAELMEGVRCLHSGKTDETTVAPVTTIKPSAGRVRNCWFSPVQCLLKSSD